MLRHDGSNIKYYTTIPTQTHTMTVDDTQESYKKARNEQTEEPEERKGKGKGNAN